MKKILILITFLFLLSFSAMALFDTRIYPLSLLANSGNVTVYNITNNLTFYYNVTYYVNNSYFYNTTYYINTTNNITNNITYYTNTTNNITNNFTYYINTTNNFTNNITYYINTTNNLTNNITYYINTTNNITNNFTYYVNTTNNFTYYINTTNNISNNITYYVNTTNNLTNNITYYVNNSYYINTTNNITNNITYYVNTTNNITNNFTYYINNSYYINTTNNISNNYTTIADFTNVAYRNESNNFNQTNQFRVPVNFTDASNRKLFIDYTTAAAEGFMLKTTIGDIILYPRSATSGNLLPYDDGYVNLGSSIYRFNKLYLKTGIEFNPGYSGGTAIIGTQNNKGMINITSDRQIDIQNANITIKDTTRTDRLIVDNFLEFLGTVDSWSVNNLFSITSNFVGQSNFNGLTDFNNDVNMRNFPIKFYNSAQTLSSYMAWNETYERGQNIIDTNLDQDRVLIHDHAAGGIYVFDDFAPFIIPMPLMWIPDNANWQRDLYDNEEWNGGNQIICNVSGTHLLMYSVTFQYQIIPPNMPIPYNIKTAIFKNTVILLPNSQCEAGDFIGNTYNLNCQGMALDTCIAGDTYELQYQETLGANNDQLTVTQAQLQIMRAFK